MNYTREIVATLEGDMKVMTGEMKKLMKKGIERHLVPLSEAKGPRLKLDKESQLKINELKKEIQSLKRQVSKLESQKDLPGNTPSEIHDLDNQIEWLHFNIFEAKTKIRDIKIDLYKKQTSTIDLDA